MTEQLSFFSPSPVQQPRPRRFNEDARVRKSNGQFLAAKRAGKLWQVNAMLALQKFIASLKDRAICEFTFEEFRIHCAVMDLPEPASVNAWGALPKEACRLGFCVWTGKVANAVRGPSHSRLIKVWRAL